VAEPILNYTPHCDVREELRHKVESAPVDHAEAVLAAYKLLQEAQDHGVLDTLRGAIGAGGSLIGEVSEYANTPEGIRLLRNLLAAIRLIGELDPEILSAAAKAMSHTRRNKDENWSAPSLLRSLQRLAGSDSRRALAAVGEFSESFGSALFNSGSETAKRRQSQKAASGLAVPVVASAVFLVVAGLWIGRRSSGRRE
jgi:uncharacterized protein YjgD (DUF1641 family)